VPADLIGEQGYNYAQLSCVEVVDSPVLGGIIARIVNTTFQPQSQTVLT
jgi:hypothetical protein